MRKYPEYMEQEVIDLYKLGLSYKAIANQLEIGFGYVSNVISRAGIARSKAGARGMRLKHDFFDSIDTEEKAYILGFLVADGCIRDRTENEGGNLQKCICLEIHKDDSYILSRFSELVNCKNKLTEHKNCLILRFHSNHMAEVLSKFGIVPRKTGYEYIDWIDTIPAELQRHVLRGLIDGDGWIGTTVKRKNYMPNIGLASSFECVDKVSRFLSEKLKITQVSPIEHGGCYMISYDGKESCAKISRYLYKDSTIYLTRKYDTAMEIIKLWS